MNKKGITWGVLLGLVLTALLFVGTCSATQDIVSGVFTKQAKENFNSFVLKIQDQHYYGPTEAQDIRNDLLILDSGTMLVYFDGNVPLVTARVDPSNFFITINGPIECLGDERVQGCICLFRTSDVRTDFDMKTMDIEPLERSCTKLDFKLEYAVDNCGIGVPVNVNSYTCRNGFFADRNVIGTPEIGTHEMENYYKNERRINFNIVKDPSKQDVITIGQPKVFAR